MTGARVVRVGSAGAELVQLAVMLGRWAEETGRRVVAGIAGAPGAGKSTVAGEVAALLGARCAIVPLDGFHLADRELTRLGLLERKGAPETFDAWGYAATLARLRSRPAHPVYVPAFERHLEQPLAGAIAVPASVDVVLTEGNYLLLDASGWREARSAMDEVWFAVTDQRVRRDRLLARHVRFGKTPEAARRWVDRVDEANATLVAPGADAAEVVLDLTDWAGAVAGS